MPSILPNYEYDIFISYRQKDNRSDQWVTKFVQALSEELDATFKEAISIYFDENPHDGLLETHDVDQSLNEKIKSLIFIPIISQTYCDPNCFAWQKEFLAFRDFAKSDQFGLDIKLTNGNVAKRILPVRIHEIDETDKQLFEKETSGVLRAIHFVYMAAGVNRPLKIEDDLVRESGKILYRDQVNKVANAIKEIIYNIIQKPVASTHFLAEDSDTRLLAKNSIIVLPFVNMSNDQEQEYFSDGLTDELISDISGLDDLLVISRSTSMTFKNSDKKVVDIAKEVNAQFALEGSVRKFDNNLRINAQLIDTERDVQIWVKKFDGKLEDVFKIQEMVCNAIVSGLELKLNEKERKSQGRHNIKDVEAFDIYMKAKQAMWQWTDEGLSKAITLTEKALSITGENSTLYAMLGSCYITYLELGMRTDPEFLEKANDYAIKSISIDNTNSSGHFCIGLTYYKKAKMKEAIISFRQAYRLDPQNPEPSLWLSISFFIVGRFKESRKYAEIFQKLDPQAVIAKVISGWIYYYEGNVKKGLPYYQRWMELDPTTPFTRWCCALIYWENGLIEDSLHIYDSLQRDASMTLFGKAAGLIIDALSGNKNAVVESVTEELKKEAESNEYAPNVMALLYALIDETEEAIGWLKVSISKGFINYPYFANHKTLLFRTMGKDKAYQEFLIEVKQLWEDFDFEN